MLHKILSTYPEHPYSDGQEHPDGELWLINMDEWDDIPYGTLVEDIMTGKTTRRTKETPTTHLTYGIRGYRE